MNTSATDLAVLQDKTPTQVRKRDGVSLQFFDHTKIASAVKRAWSEVRGDVSEYQVYAIVNAAVAALQAEIVDVEAVQDAVENALMRNNCGDVARAYILYRKRHAEARALSQEPDRRAAADYIHAGKYARWRADLGGRREVYAETVNRTQSMHLRRFQGYGIDHHIEWAFDRVHEKRVLPSMRSFQFAGAAMEAIHNRGYNCCATLIDRPRAFAEALFLLLCGSGIGYSVQFDHVERLPALAPEINRGKVSHHVVGDTIQGWAEALDALIASFMVPSSDVYGTHVEFAYHLIRPAGTVLKTSGGRAPGHLKLKEALEQIRAILRAACGRKLRPIECHRILCHAADAVLSGGIRRSAMICLFSIEDGELMYCKADRNWFDREPWLANANNSVVLKRGDVTQRQFNRIFQATRHYGEPGIVFVNDYNFVCNPCAEIMFNVLLQLENGERKTGWGMCNLTEMNASMFETANDFFMAACAASIIGTLQASYTDMPFLGPVTEAIVRRDALLGVSMTGMQHKPKIALDPGVQREAAAIVVATNKEFASIIGINQAARTTCVKPAGTTTLELDLDCSGIGRAHARRFIRRVTATELEVPFQKFRETNPHMCVKKPNGEWVVEFPRQVPAGTLLKEDQSAIEFIDDVLLTQRNWVAAGTVREDNGLQHNVSNTVQVRPHEWEDVAAYLWKHQNELTGISLLPDDGDTIYPFAPFEAVKTEAQKLRFRELVAHYKPVDYFSMFEAEDGTSLSGEAACAGGACELKF